MKFGLFYELQLPKPWGPDDELRLVQDALTQVELADRLGIDYAWAVEHHFLEEYSHCSASEVFLAAAAARTQRIRLGHGIRQVIANYNHPARTAEAIAMLDLVSKGEAEARAWSQIYYDTIKSDACVPLGHSVNANIAMVSAFSLHADRAEAVRRGKEGFEFFRFAISALVTNDAVPGRSRLFEQFHKE